MVKRVRKSTHLAKDTIENVNDPLQAEIIDRLQRVKFKRKFFGGVDEADVWKKIGELNSLYERALLAKTEYQGETDE